MILFLLSAFSLSAATWFASADGSSTNGEYSSPWSPQFSVTNTNPHLKTGDTVIFKNGYFACTEQNIAAGVGQVLEFRKSGITYRSETLWGFTFDGGLLLTTSNLTVEQFRITYSPNAISRNRTNAFTHPPGISDFGTGNRILHNLIDGTGHPGIASWKTTQGKYIAGNIIRFTGYNDWALGYNGSARGSGMYLQNLQNSSEAVIQGNISYFNYTTGMKAYGNTDIWGFVFHNNICAENKEAGIFFHQDNYPSTNLVVDSNYLWNNGSGVRVGYPLGRGGHSNAVVVNNYAVDNGYSSYPFSLVDGWYNTTWTNNTGVALRDRYGWLLEVYGEAFGDTASHHMDFNAYYATNYGGYGAKPFFIKETNKLTFSEWQAEVHGETNSTFSYSTPATNSVFLFWPSSDTNFVNAAVFNWTGASSTTVNLKGAFPGGSRLEIYDAQDIPNAYTNFCYCGCDVALDLTRTNRATMLGNFQGRTWQGFDPRFRAFVIHRM